MGLLWECDCIESNNPSRTLNNPVVAKKADNFYFFHNNPGDWDCTARSWDCHPEQSQSTQKPVCMEMHMKYVEMPNNI